MEQPTADCKEGCMAAPSHSCLASLFRLRTICTCIILLIVSLGPSSPRLWLQLQLARRRPRLRRLSTPGQLRLQLTAAAPVA